MEEEKVVEAVESAFREFMVTRFNIPKKAVPAYWEIFLRSFEWRIHAVFGKKVKNTFDVGKLIDRA